MRIATRVSHHFISWYSPTTYHGIEGAVNCNCSSWKNLASEFQPVVFYYDIRHSAFAFGATISLCKPTIQLWDVTVTVDLSSGQIKSIDRLAEFGSNEDNADELNQFASGITDTPLFGKAYNGMYWDNVDSFDDPEAPDRLRAVQITLPAAVLQAATDRGVLTNSDFPESFTELSNRSM